MRPPEYSKEDVIAAGQELISQGKTVTGFGLRGLLGGGNAQRLRAIWDEYQAGSPEHVAPSPEFPPELEAEIKGAAERVASLFLASAKDVYAQACKAADKRVSDAMAAAQEQAVNTERELAAADVLADSQQQTIVEQLQQIEELKKALATAQNQIQAHAVQVATAEERERALKEQLEKATALHSSTLIEIKELQQAVSSKKEEKALLTAQIQVLEQEKTHLKHDGQAKQTALVKEVQDLKTELALQIGNLQEAEAALEKLQIEKSQQEGEIKALKEQNIEFLAKLHSNKESKKESSNETKPTAKATANNAKKSPQRVVKGPIKSPSN